MMQHQASGAPRMKLLTGLLQNLDLQPTRKVILTDQEIAPRDHDEISTVCTNDKSTPEKRTPRYSARYGTTISVRPSFTHVRQYSRMSLMSGSAITIGFRRSTGSSVATKTLSRPTSPPIRNDTGGSALAAYM